MIARVSRRNGRAFPSRPRKRDVLLLMVSLVVFAGGAASLACALQADPPASEVSPPAVAPKASSAPRQYEGVLHAPQDDAGESNPDSDREPFDGELAEATPGVPEANAMESFDEAEANAPLAPRPSSPAQSPAPSVDQAPASQQVTIIHHTAYREDPIYRTVHHQASSAREIVENGRPRIEWSLCPVCMQRHDKAFNERVVDHVNQVLCSACGARHETAYDEMRAG